MYLETDSMQCLEEQACPPGSKFDRVKMTCSQDCLLPLVRIDSECKLVCP
jgi:hypothetical protein